VRAVRQAYPEVIISVDTFQSRVAAAALDCGADMINDVSAGRLDDKMHDVVMSWNCLWVQMHMRGTPQTMTSAAMRDYRPEGAVVGSASELGSAVARAVCSGIPRWQLLVDPGIGFAKDATQSAAILRDLASWRRRVGPYPCVVGVSRKSALCGPIPRLRQEDVAARDFATSGAVVAAMYAGAEMFRLHNPKVADALRAARCFGCS
jgi:dihydropteroate synthase